MCSPCLVSDTSQTKLSNSLDVNNSIDNGSKYSFLNTFLLCVLHERILYIKCIYKCYVICDVIKYVRRLYQPFLKRRGNRKIQVIWFRGCTLDPCKYTSEQCNMSGEFISFLSSGIKCPSRCLGMFNSWLMTSHVFEIFYLLVS